MRINKYLRYFLITLLLCCGAVVTSCSKSDEPDPMPEEPVEQTGRTILVYAIGSNSLSSYVQEDLDEIIAIAPSLDLKNNNIVIYSIQSNQNPKLRVLQIDRDGAGCFETVREYDRELFSTDPERMRQVIADVKDLYRTPDYGLVLWSHGSAWNPSPGALTDSSLYWFGQDVNGKEIDYMDVADLQAGLPDHGFSFIWFDACYMANVETVYAIKDKCDYVIGYPTEVAAVGMRYDLSLPYLLMETPDYVTALDATYVGITTTSSSYFTGSVIATQGLEEVAEATRALVYGTPALTKEKRRELLCFSRNMKEALYHYDLRDYAKTRALAAIPAITDDMTAEEREAVNAMRQDVEAKGAALEEALTKLVPHTVHTQRGFNGAYIYDSKYSGISCCAFDDDSTPEMNFYKTLEWWGLIYK